MQGFSGRRSSALCRPQLRALPPGTLLGPRRGCAFVQRNLAGSASSIRHKSHRRHVAVSATDREERPWTGLLQLVKPVLVRGTDQTEAVPDSALSHLGGAGINSGSTAGSQPMEETREVYENQRAYGVVGWKAPLSVLDRPEWTDAYGTPVSLPERPSEDSSQWELVVNGATDDEGWQYATVFKHLEYKRPGGRSSARFGDTVRRRLWRRCPAAGAATISPGDVQRSSGDSAAPAATAAAAAAAAGAAATTAAAAAALRAAREADAKRKAVKHFMSMVLDLVSRRPVWSLLPWDPAALYVLYQKHQQVYQELQVQAYERRLFTADQPPPPSQLREGHTLLQDLLCAAMHSRAAYGFPAAQGMMSSVTDYLRLQTVQPLTFDAVGGVSAEANNEAVAALAGIEPHDIIMAEWRNTPFRPCHYVAIDRSNQCIVLSIRGSLQLGDLLSDLAASPLEVRVGGGDGWVHQGIFAAATFVHCNTQEALAEAARRCPGWPLLLAGHSLGGGVAALVTLLLQESGLPQGIGPMRCITIGTAAVMSRPLAEHCQELVTSVIVGTDAVPHLSLASVEALLVEAAEASPVRRTVQGWGSKLAGMLGKGSGKQAERSSQAASASASASSTAKLPGTWAAVQEASARLGRTTSHAGLARLLSGAGEERRGQSVRQIPILVQQQAPAGRPGWVQLLQQQAPQRIPVIDANEQAPQQQQWEEQGRDEGQQGQKREARVQNRRQQHQQQMHAERQQHGRQDGEGDDVLPSLCQFDAPMADAALAQDASAKRRAATLADPETQSGSGGGGGAASSSGESGGGPGDPELLFPPGRIIWIFPGDVEQDAGDVAVQAEAEQQLEAMDTAWQGSSPSATQAQKSGGQQLGRSGLEAVAELGQQKAAPEQREDEPQDRSRGRYDMTNTDPAVQSRGAVDVGEAVATVEAEGTSVAPSGGSVGSSCSAGGSTGGPSPSGQQRRQSVAVDADRSSFERLLLLADMLNDHLPDRYVSALQQL